MAATDGAARDIVMTGEGRRVHAGALVVDGHNDLPWALREAGDTALTRYDLSRVETRFHTDLPRLALGNVGAQFWSVYVPSSTADDGVANQMTLEQIDLVQRLVAKYPDRLALARGTDEIRAARAAGKIASLVGVEGGHAIEDSLDKLRDLYARGARYMTLTHSKNTAWCDSATDSEVHGGLTDFGRDVVREMNRLGMLVDISHISAKAMKDVLAASAAPVIASHSSAYAVTPHPRNVPDDVLALVRENDGVVMVNFYTKFIQHGGARTDVDTLLDHIDHIAQVAGVAHVGLGSDYDGIPTLPRQLDDVSTYPYITQGLLDRGYSEADVHAILGGNLMRAFARAEAVAAEMGGG